MWRQIRMRLLIGVPLVVGGTLLRHYSFHAFELLMFGFSIALTFFSIWLICRSWPTREQRLEGKSSAAYAGVIMASFLLIVSLYGNYIVLPVVTG
ncbi:hypothetical protein EJ076_18790 [Mesorhizobium sp. M7D.F.Ca.US.005.01.1.1]|uniref:hypothetical protein n=1 Tax=Mesorhizobium sp. M7D.F.Ca.US.005.01.1.1 TaxID=2493678 RepID=UPI000F761D8F|nr:hypothetical protein [Mesorhizobium sp. M7D.F.Ca.US.005.01.1.1]AZO42992.1 hypothetical protein EJ076_18790 [Mesorhizobium sp. M7D.F.Ca.US.005.01.1.1]